MRKFLLFSAATLAIVTTITTAKAQTFTYTGYNVDPNNVVVDVTSPAPGGNFLAGEIFLHGSGPNAGQNLAVWCLDLVDALQQGPYTYQETTVSLGGGVNLPSVNLSASQLQQIGDLMLFGESGSDPNKAATQLAIWLVEYGNQLQITGLDPTLNATATSQIASVQPGGSHFDNAISVTFLHDAPVAPNQTVAFAAAVPGPLAGAGLPGLVMGFGAWWVARRKRRIA